jgi:HK97 family phage prohead protease
MNKKRANMEKEVRQINIPVKVEKRGTIVGYPIVYSRDSEDMGFIEQIAPGAAKNALERSDIRALKNHDPSLIYGRQGVNLTFSEDKNGLRYEATPIDTRNFKDVAEEINAGLLTGQSFGFTVLSDEWTDLETDHPRRTITEIGEIYDVGVVTYPAYPDTTVALRALDAARAEISPAPEQEAPTFTLAEIVTLTIDGEEFVFDGENRFDLAAEKIEEIRASISPTTAIDADAELDPTITEDSVEVEERDAADILARINETITRSKT